MATSVTNLKIHLAEARAALAQKDFAQAELTTADFPMFSCYKNPKRHPMNDKPNRPNKAILPQVLLPLRRKASFPVPFRTGHRADLPSCADR